MGDSAGNSKTQTRMTTWVYLSVMFRKTTLEPVGSLGLSNLQASHGKCATEYDVQPQCRSVSNYPVLYLLTDQAYRLAGRDEVQ